MNIEKLINEYAEWLKKEISFNKIGDYYEITTPYLNNQNDYLQIYIIAKDNNIFFTDDGETVNNLEATGFQFTPARKIYFNQILNQYGVEYDNKTKELTLKSTIKTFAFKKHLFVQAMLRIDDLFTISKSKVSSYFLEDIELFFNSKEIYYSDNVQFVGTSGFTHSYDFLLQRSKSKPERLCKAINAPTKSIMMNTLFSWTDTKPVRKENSQLIVFLNDEKKIPSGIEEGFSKYDAQIIKWSQRNEENNISLLIA